MTGQRRLAAILAADVAGYSRLVAIDEAAALTALRNLRSGILEPTVAEHGGRLFKTMGDGFLAEFPSTVEALRCALAIQAANGTDAVLRLRVGLHQGDVVVEGDDLLGDGVNVAARIESLAEPGGIALSGRVREDAAGRVSFAALEDMGERELKNIPAPVRVFRIAPGASVSAPEQAPKLATLDRPALAVLPFANMSGDAEQEYFADGITEELITQLSRARWFYVIARHSTFTYKGRAVDIRQVGRELGVRYVLEGSVRKGGGRLRITGQLIEAETGHHVWADRYDGSLDDIFDLQDRVSEAVAAAIEPSLQHSEIKRAQAKPTSSLSAYDLYLQALHHQRTLTREGSTEALRLLRAAAALDPEFALAKAQLGFNSAQLIVNMWANENLQIEGIQCAREALTLGRDDPLVLALAAFAIAFHTADYAATLAAVGRAQALNPNSPQIALCAGWIHNFASEPDLAITAFQRAMRLSPLDPAIEYIYVGLASAHIALADYESALRWAQRSVHTAPTHAPGHRYVVISYWLLGKEDEARSAASAFLSIFPDARALIRRYRDDAFRQKLVGAMLAAGIPE